MLCIRRRFLYCLAASAICTGAPALASAEPEEPKNPRELDSHVFIPSQLIPHPFTSTYVNEWSGYGYAHATGPKFNVMGAPVGTSSYDLGAMEQTFDLQVLLLPVWSIRAGFGARIYTGATGDALFGVGSSVQATANVGTTVSFPVGRIARVGGVLDYQVGPEYSLNVAAALVDTVRSRQADLSNLVTTTTTNTIVPGVVGAIALHRSLGLAAAIRYSHAIPSTEGITRANDDLLFGASVDFDLKALTVVPVGFIASYQLTVPVGGPQNFTQNALNLGIFYTGRVNMVVGPDLFINWFTLTLVPDSYLPNLPLTREADATSYGALLVLRYYWQP